eukprot:159276-Chlamydomonas_euryale.AAC.2
MLVHPESPYATADQVDMAGGRDKNGGRRGKRSPGSWIVLQHAAEAQACGRQGMRSGNVRAASVGRVIPRAKQRIRSMCETGGCRVCESSGQLCDAMYTRKGLGTCRRPAAAEGCVDRHVWTDAMGRINKLS